MAVGIQTLSSGTKQVPYMAMTDAAMACAAPIVASDFDKCRMPGGVDLWERQGFYSPGVCFAGYNPLCPQTRPPQEEWPLRVGETAVRCVPEGYKCNREDKDQRFATLESSGTVISAPAFEVRWRSEDLKGMGQSQPLPGGTTGPVLATKGGVPTATVTLSNTTDGSTAGSGATATTSRTESDTGSAGIEAGVVAGIAVGCALAAFVLALAIVFLFRYRRQKQKEGANAASNADDREPGLIPPAPGGVAEVDGATAIAEADGTPTGRQESVIPRSNSGHGVGYQGQRDDNQDHSGPVELELRQDLATELPVSSRDGVGGLPTSPASRSGCGSGSVSAGASVSPALSWRHRPVEVASASEVFELPG
ncbi:hypothetical protein JDV02_010544 [Purpureocillium takamizusanense]|uniref:Uncharacterized protein n=1 Tax=Purpureocillium takamizusanense TaxID=2060973 RepID=A0A9Q8VGN6_9HYPO|nr:uncharacterized protein JDV02_010544 [Purpureocillium takamizusanense]UNI24828.1 hypothetical protein JDV02_010544 [Purpureocillium takamizusanense]